MWRQRGVSEQCLAGCCPHDGASLGGASQGGASQGGTGKGGGLPGGGCPRDLPDAALGERVVHLRGCQLLPVQKIAALTGVGRELISRLLYEAAADGGLHGPARRMTARTPEDERLDQAIARMAQEDRARTARVAPPSWRGPSEAELLAALHADPEVRRVLDRHGVPVLSLSGPAWQRFPAPRPLTVGLVGDLYEGCGLGLHHIELLTGRPAAAVGAVLRDSGIKLRPAGGRSPFTERWRPARE
jgi:hypothetical protein